ncbi:peptidyl-prolyl cis-trans isomerase H, partial [Eurytemora carolleeae]|uniref:peptidyl-prolyl cis-trans isomerase H n=1 Tax=Eurytemora carolleeae TaxID=1294199 RepID=UPI000C7934B2
MCKKGEGMPEQLVDDDDYGDTIMSSETEFGVDETRINADPQPITETLSSPFKKPKVTKPAFDFPPAYLGGADNQAVLAAHPSSSNNPLVFLDINLGDDFVGRIIIELFANVVPRTAENFRQLCIGVEKEGKKIGYKGTIFHRVINRFMLQGGDFENSDGSGGESIYGKQFEDENFLLKHEVAGQVSMANSGPNTNGSQFFISTVSCPHLDDKHVVFGIVKKGLGILTDIEVLPGDSQDKPLVPVTIVNSGEIKPDQDQGICENDGTPDVYPHHPEDLELDWYLQSNFSTILNILKDIKESGNIYYRKGDHVAATRKYKKCYKYITMLRDTVGSTDDEEEIKVRERSE